MTLASAGFVRRLGTLRTGPAVAFAVVSLALVGGVLSTVAVEGIALGPLHCFGGERCDPNPHEQLERLALVA